MVEYSANLRIKKQKLVSFKLVVGILNNFCHFTDQLAPRPRQDDISPHQQGKAGSHEEGSFLTTFEISFYPYSFYLDYLYNC